MCAPVGVGGRPSDIVPARLSQPQLDELCGQYEIADVLPLTPLQQGLLFHAGTAGVAAMMCMRCSWRWRSAVRWMCTGCVMRCTRWSSRHPNLVARFCAQFDEPVQVICG